MSTKKVKRKGPLLLGEQSISPGKRLHFEVPVARLPTDTWLSLPIVAVVGRYVGPTIWLSAAIHGDELNGVEVIRRVVKALRPLSMCGAVIAVPVVNVFGFINESRYLPDRRDLNRCFPGSKRGSLAARIAKLFMQIVVAQCQYGIDLHTGADHRTNAPQIRGDLGDPEVLRIAEAFGPDFIVHARSRDGSLREAARAVGIPVLLFEGGEPHRYDERVIREAVRGVLNVMSALGMRAAPLTPPAEPPKTILKTAWIRAKRSGLFRTTVAPGMAVTKGQVIGYLGDALGERSTKVKATKNGYIIGLNQNPIVNRGDALCNLGLELDPK